MKTVNDFQDATGGHVCREAADTGGGAGGGSLGRRKKYTIYTGLARSIEAYAQHLFYFLYLVNEGNFSQISSPAEENRLFFFEN